jgi:hypothetical protein
MIPQPSATSRILASSLAKRSAWTWARCHEVSALRAAAAAPPRLLPTAATTRNNNAASRLRPIAHSSREQPSFPSVFKTASRQHDKGPSASLASLFLPSM